ncbi:MAG TPA: MFS transporter [Micromonospora sp.]|nr:MFS transporter [Micromonospora sp.]
MTERVRPHLLITIWLSQLVSLIGSSLTGFVLGVWTYQKTGSVTQFALIFLASTLPGVLVAPFAGVLADRYDRRRLMLLTDTGAAVGTAVLAVLVATDSLQVWHIWTATALTAAFNVVHQVSYQAMTPALVGKKNLGRFNGFMQITRAVQIAAPVLAGVLWVTIGVGGVMLIDLGTFAVAALTLLLVPLSKEVTQPPAGGSVGARKSALREAAAGWQYLRQRSGLLSLVLLFGGFNFLFGIAGVLVQPLILSFTTPDTLGILMFAGGSGLFLGSLVMGAWGGPARRINAVFAGLTLGGVALIGHSLAPSVWLIGVAAPLFLFTLPVLNSSAMTIIQTKTEPSVLGRVLATARVLAEASVPVAYLLAGPLADGIFEPLMQPDGALAGSIGAAIGTGDGRGTALLFAVAGALMLVLTAVAWAHQPLRNVDLMPDALSDPSDTPPRTEQPKPADDEPATVDPRPDVAEPLPDVAEPLPGDPPGPAAAPAHR